MLPEKVASFLAQSIPEHWVPFAYQYIVGGFIFLAGLALILRNRSCILSQRSDRFWFGVLLAGFLWYSGIHLFWYLAAIYIMPEQAGGAG